MVFSTNQNRQLFVSTGFTADVEAPFTSLNAVGKMTSGVDADNHLYFVHKGYGGLVRSDLIKPSSIMWVNATAPEDMELTMKKYTVVLDTNVNSGNPIPGQDYILRINFRQLYGMSDEDIYQKYGAVHATAAMEADKTKFYAEMVYSLIKNFSRLYAPLIDIKVNNTIVAKATKSGSTVTLLDASGNTISPNSNGFELIEKPQVAEWALGTKQLTRVYFDVIPTTVLEDNVEVVWGVATPGQDTTTVGNGYIIADLEYFCMGERADQYRNTMWPKSIPTKYLVDSSKTYYTLDIHYAFQGSCEDIQKSEKTLTIVAEDVDDIEGIISELKKLNVEVHKTAGYKAATDDSSASDEPGGNG
jgi:hypothetical protein